VGPILGEFRFVLMRLDALDERLQALERHPSEGEPPSRPGRSRNAWKGSRVYWEHRLVETDSSRLLELNGIAR
ncbi:MAG TPA: hypothetical protein VJP76_06105, partial [Candidatus Tumulicola sp.]|nr:hypothetical protein [Candidatus Tumulicola sp.]